MSKTDYLFIGSDKRMKEASRYMNSKGLTSVHHSTDAVTDDLLQLISDKKPAQIVFPVLQMKGRFPSGSIPAGTKLFAGIHEHQWAEQFSQDGLPVVSYLSESRFLWENAVLTAEGFLKEYYADTDRPVNGSAFIIAGFGRVGKTAARLLFSMGADITILARSSEQLGEAEAAGYTAQAIDEVTLPKKGVLVNTIPAQWLFVASDSRLRIYDLSSMPGCLKDNVPDEYYTIHLRLPGRHFPFEAARALAGAVLRLT